MFTKEGMFLIQNNSQAIRVYKLANENNDYIAFYRIDYVCGECHSTYNENPGTCEVCGSTDIREREMDLFPIG